MKGLYDYSYKQSVDNVSCLHCCAFCCQLVETSKYKLCTKSLQTQWSNLYPHPWPTVNASMYHIKLWHILFDVKQEYMRRRRRQEGTSNYVELHHTRVFPWMTELVLLRHTFVVPLILFKKHMQCTVTARYQFFHTYLAGRADHPWLHNSMCFCQIWTQKPSTDCTVQVCWVALMCSCVKWPDNNNTGSAVNFN